jgi:serine/threonine protein kinase
MHFCNIQPSYPDQSIANPFSIDTFQCPWMISRPPLPMEYRRPFNPCADAEFCDLLNGMLQINPDQRLSASQVIRGLGF